MSLKKDKAGNRYVEMKLELPGTPEEIWQAMATGPGYAAWFLPTEIDERVGGDITFDFGDGVTSGGKVTVWQPPHRFGYEEYNWSGEAPPVATEITIEAQAGGTCKVRMVHSLFTDRDDWDKEVESFEKGWPGFFRVLRIYLASFAGMKAVQAHIRGNFPEAADAAWLAFRQRLGLADATVGEPVSTDGQGAPRLAGKVEHIAETGDKREMLLQLDQPTPGTLLIGTYEWGEQVHVAMNLILYGAEAEAAIAKARPQWRAWMDEHFQAGQPAG